LQSQIRSVFPKTPVKLNKLIVLPKTERCLNANVLEGTVRGAELKLSFIAKMSHFVILSTSNLALVFIKKILHTQKLPWVTKPA